MSETQNPQQNRKNRFEPRSAVPPPPAVASSSASNPSPPNSVNVFELLPSTWGEKKKKNSVDNFQRRRSLPKEPRTPSKDILCQRWMWGTCKLRASKCMYAHGIKQLKSTSTFIKTAYCKAWLRGICLKGNKCRHAHGAHELNFGSSGSSVALTEDQGDSGEDTASSGKSMEDQDLEATSSGTNFEESSCSSGAPWQVVASAATAVEEPMHVFLNSPDFSRHQQKGVKGSFKGKGSAQRHALQPAMEAASVVLADVAWELDVSSSQHEPLRLIPTLTATPKRRAALQGTDADTSRVLGSSARQAPRTSKSFFPPLGSIPESKEHGVKEEL